MDDSTSKISNIEWGFVIGFLLLIDLAQILLDFVGIGLILNRFLDIFIGMSFAFYLQMRGQSMVNPKRLAALVGTFVGEMIPVVDALPLWCLDGILNMVMSRSSKILKNVPGGGIVESGLELANSNMKGSMVEKVKYGTQQIENIKQQIQNSE